MATPAQPQYNRRSAPKPLPPLVVPNDDGGRARRLPALPPGADVWRTEEFDLLGLGSRTIAKMVAAGHLVRTRHGCYVRGAYWRSLPEPGRQRALILAHHHGTLARSTGLFVYSHTSAARLHSLFLWNADNYIHISTPFKPSTGGYGADVRAHFKPVGPQELVSIDGVPATSLERTALDCALALRYQPALILMDHALRKGASRPALQKAAERLSGHRGIRTLRAVLENADPRAESPGETLARDAMRMLRIPDPVPQFDVMTAYGLYRLDFAWPLQRVALEFDGKTKYFDHGPTDEVVFRERQREKALVAAGWTVVRIEWRDLFDQASLKARLLSALRNNG